MKNVAIILAGGIGKRVGLPTPKQFLKLKGKPLFMWSMDSLVKHPAIDRVLFVYNKSFFSETINILQEYNLSDKVELVEGGNERQISSYNALKYLKGSDVKNVLIHDAARPIIDEELIANIISCLNDCEACVPVVRLKESICKIADREILKIENREEFRVVQTPQGFDYETIILAHEKALEDNVKNSLDDSSLVLRLGKVVKFVDGDPLNIKVTYEEDLKIAELFVNLKGW